MRPFVLVCCYLLALHGAATAEDADFEALDPAALIAKHMARDRLPSFSVAVGREGVLRYAAAFGLADLENGVPATVKTIYRVGSLSKPVTAAAVLQLVQGSLLDLDQPVQRYCPSFPDKSTLISPRLLLAHLGGIRHYNYRRFQEEFLSKQHYATLEEALGVFKDDPLAAAPGEQFLYSSFGYVLLGCAVEGASGLGFGEYLQQQVFSAAKMAQARLDQPAEIVPFRARGYSMAEDGAWRNSPFVDLSDRYPAGGLLATPTDLVAFGAALLDGRLLSPQMRAAMLTQQQTRSGEESGYGLGWRLSDRPGEVFHGGSSVGGSAYLYMRVASGTVVALATNLDRWSEPRHELARALADWAESQW